MAKETILVVDDTPRAGGFRRSAALTSYWYKALAVYDGKSTLKLLQSVQPDLILMDLELPDTTGLDLLRKIQQTGLNIPTILVTAHGSERVVVDAFRLGVEDYLIKPVDASLLENAISRALTEHRLRQETIRLNAQLQEQISWLNALSKVGQSITSTLELDDVLCRIIEAGIQLTQAEEGFLALLEAQSKQLYIRAAKYASDDNVTTLNLLVEDTLVNKVINSQQTLRLPGPQETQLIKISTGLLVHSLIYTPILFRNRPLGVLAVYNRLANRSFLPKDEVMLTSLADYAAVAIENAGLYQKAQHEITERKRVEKALRVSEERYALAVEGAADGIWDWNLRTQKIYYSPRWKAMLGYSDSEIGDDPQEWFDRVHPEDVEKLKLAITNHIQGFAQHLKVSIVF
jgi:two-component system NtrC family sensor kinase